MGEEELKEGGQKIQTSSWKSVSPGDVIYDPVAAVSPSVWYIGESLPVNPKSCPPKEKKIPPVFFPLSLLFIPSG